MVKAHGPHFSNNSLRNACAPDDFGPRIGADSPTRSSDDGNSLGTYQVRCLHCIYGQGLWALHGKRLLQHHERELRLQPAERSRSAVGMCGDRHV
jgi:hypothetical protein